MLRLDGKEEGCCNAFDFCNARIECFVGNFLWRMVQVTVCICNEPPNDTEPGPCADETHGEHQNRPTPFHIDQRCKYVLNQNQMK